MSYLALGNYPEQVPRRVVDSRADFEDFLFVGLLQCCQRNMFFMDF